MAGWIMLHREIMESKFWLKQKFTRAQAWVDILLITNYKESSFYIRDNEITVQRGQFAFSERALAKRWKWSQTRVQTFLKYLEKVEKISAHRNKILSCYTVLNYNKYQNPDEEKLTRNSQETHKKLNTKNVKNVKNIYNENSPINIYIKKFNELFESKHLSTDGRKDKLTTRLNSYTLDQILVALDNLAASPFHRGNNDRSWIADPDFLIRNDEQVDKWLNKGKPKELSMAEEAGYISYEEGKKKGLVW